MNLKVLTNAQLMLLMGIKNPLVNPAILAIVEDSLKANVGNAMSKAMRRAVQVKFKQRFTSTT